MDKEVISNNLNINYDYVINKFISYMVNNDSLKEKVLEVKFSNFQDFEAQFIFDVCANLLYLFVKDLKVNVKCSLFTYWKLLRHHHIYRNKRFRKVEKVVIEPQEFLGKFFAEELAINNEFVWKYIVKDIEKEYYGRVL